MEKTIEHFSKQVSAVSAFAGVNDVLLVENIQVDGSPLKYIASVSGRGRIEIRPFDIAKLQDILDACLANNYQAYKASKTSIVVSVAPLDKERKLEVEKQIKQMAETAKISIRNIRRKFKISDETTKGYTNKIDEIIDSKLTILRNL